MPLRTECKRGAEEGNGIVETIFHAIGETIKNGVGKIAERCSSLRMPIRTVGKHRLKVFDGIIEMVLVVAQSVESICLVCCISDGIDLMRPRLRKPIISYNNNVLE